MNVFAFHAGVLFIIVCDILAITGHLAVWAYKLWGGRPFDWLFLGGITDLNVMKKFYRWFGIITLPLVVFIYVTTFLIPALSSRH